MSKKGGGDFGAKLGKLMTYTNDSLSSYKKCFLQIQGSMDSGEGDAQVFQSPDTASPFIPRSNI